MATGLANLKIYQMAKRLELQIHDVVKEFPREEKFRSVDQLKRSSTAVTSNIAEAYNKQSTKDKIHILRDISVCEAEETESNILRCTEKGFMPDEKANVIAAQYVGLKKAINGYIRFLRKTNQLLN